VNAQIPAGALNILQALERAGHEAYLVGGCVRDLLRGVAPHDWDICTSARPEETRASLAGARIVETGLKHGTVTVLTGGMAFEVTTYRADGPYSDGRRPDCVRFVTSVQEDLARRDFTMNAIAMDRGGGLCDPFGGKTDISRRLIRCVGEGDRRFQEDALRIMRALRFAACLGYQVEEGTRAALHRCSPMLGHIAAERINVELCKLIVGPFAGAVLREYPDVLCRFWPQLLPLVELEQHTPWHCWGGWEHTLHALEAAPPDRVVRLAVLLHDVGKPSCKTTDAQGIDHFYGHPAVGARMADEMLRALRFDNDTRRRVAGLVAYHDVQLVPTQRALRRWLGRLGPEAFFQLLEVKRCDAMGQDAALAQARQKELSEIRALAEDILAQGQCFSLRDLAVDGRDVINAGIPAGAEVGRVLKALLEKVLDGEAPNERDRLLALIHQV